MPPQSSLEGSERGLRLLSLDAGGPRGTSQLKILVELMHRLNFEVEDDAKDRPCTVFDMIGGSGSGGFIAILLVIFGLTAEQSLEEFIALSVNVFEMEVANAEVRTTALKEYISNLLGRYEMGDDMHLMDSNHRSKDCKLVVPISYKSDVGNSCNIRNFDVEQEQSLNMTVSDALMATLATPPLFMPITVLKDAATFEYMSADLMLSNPIQQVISEAHGAFSAQREVACIVSPGCGYPGIITPPNDSDTISWSQFVERLVTGSEETARNLDSLIGHLGFYHRFSITHGLERISSSTSLWHGDVISHTTDYLGDPSVSRKVDMSVNSLKMTDGVAYLEDLQHPGGHRVLPASLPPLTRTFIMRTEPWKFMKKVILDDRGTEAGMPRMLAVTGMGGCGKTQLVLKFMQVHNLRFTSLLFIDGSNESRIRADIIRHIRSLGLQYSQMEFDDCLRILALSSPKGTRLILYDNVDDPKLDLGPLLPLGNGCAIIITSRNRSVGMLCQDAHLELDIMSIDEAVDLLLYTPVHSTQIPNITYEDADSIAQELGYLPIALTQARSYMYETGCSGGEYMEALLESKEKLLAEPLTAQRDMRYSSTYAAFDASFQILSSLAQELVQLLSYFHWRDFPLELIIIAAKYEFFDYEYEYAEVEYGDEFHIGKDVLEGIFLRDGKWAGIKLEEMIISLQNHSFIKLNPGVGTRLVQMHPLAHEWTRSQINEPERVKYRSASVLLLALGAREEPVDQTPTAQYLPSHVMHMSPLWDQLHVNDAEAFARILRDGGFFRDALQLRERVVTVLRGQVNPQSMDLSNSLWLVALIYQDLGQSKDAEGLQVEIQRVRNQVLGDLHPETIAASNNLASTYYNLGRLKEAKTLQLEVLRLSKRVLGELHPDTIMASSSLAATYRELGWLKEAERIQVDVLSLRKQVLGEFHSDTIRASGSLATTYNKLGRLKEAEELQVEVLRRRKQDLGEFHPETIRASGSLAITYFDLGRLKEAEMLEVELLKLSKQVLGELHPVTITLSNNLALTYRELGRLMEAQVLQVEALRLRKQVQGELHPDTIAASSNLATTYYDLGQLKEAEMLQVEALRLRKQVLGELHSDTIAVSNSLALTYYALGHLRQAEALQVEVLRLTKEVFGEVHPRTTEAMINLAYTSASLSRGSDALSLISTAETIATETLGTDHWQYKSCQEIRCWIQSLEHSSQPTKRKCESDNGDTLSGDVESMDPSSKRQYVDVPVAAQCNSEGGGDRRDWRTIVGIHSTTRAAGVLS